MSDDGYTRITLRIPDKLHVRLAAEGKRTSKSMNAEIVSRLERTFEGDLNASNKESPLALLRTRDELLSCLREKADSRRVCFRGPFALDRAVIEASDGNYYGRRARVVACIAADSEAEALLDEAYRAGVLDVAGEASSALPICYGPGCSEWCLPEHRRLLPESHMLPVLEACQGSLEKTYTVMKSWKATVESQLLPEGQPGDRLVDVYTRAAACLCGAHQAIEQLRWHILQHNANLQNEDDGVVLRTPEEIESYLGSL